MPADAPNSGVETADLEPCSETPRKLALLPAGAGRLFTPEPADHAGDDVDAGEKGVLREAGTFDVKLGGGAVVPGEGATVPAGGVGGPDGCQAGGGDDGGDK